MAPRVILDGYILALQRAGGVRRVFEELLSALAGLPEPELWVCAPCGAPSDPQIRRRVRWLREWNFRPWRIAQHVNAMRVRQACRRGGVDVFHTLWFGAAPCPGMRRVVTVCDMIHELHPSLRHDEETRQLKQKAIAEADLCIAISEQTRRDLLTVTGIASHKVRVIPLGLSRSFTSPAPEAAVWAFLRDQHIDGPYWVHVGCRGQYKNFERTAEGFARIADETNGYLVIVGGEHELGSRVGEMLDRGRCAARIRHLGPIDDAELRAIYTGAAGLVSTSLAEGFGLPLLEALGCGTLAVVSDIPVYREVLGEWGIFVDPCDATSVASGMETSLDAGARTRLAPGGREHAATFSWRKTAEAHVQAYEDLTE